MYWFRKKMIICQVLYSTSQSMRIPRAVVILFIDFNANSTVWSLYSYLSSCTVMICEAFCIFSHINKTSKITHNMKTFY